VTTSGPNLSGPPLPHVAADPAGAQRPRGGPLHWFARGGWYLFVVVLSLGILSFVPFLHAALRTRKPLMWLWVVLYVAAIIGIFLNTKSPNAGGFEIGLIIVAAVHSIVLRRQVWPTTGEAIAPAPASLGTAGWPADPAIAAVLATRARRDEARRLAAADPQMARELNIGRPDLVRSYDDGGLVDLNTVPSVLIASTCGIEPAVAEQIVAARVAGVPFGTVDDVFSLAEIPYPLWDRIRDRAVVIAG
jgi:hypothetical protein